ncbi:hypothetical protein PL11201_680084 [Planktothrix sp. PCC 11201]|nr:hypothetical protein PL11201_680084 [Planktothrix sp. PCC 11201]
MGTEVGAAGLRESHYFDSGRDVNTAITANSIDFGLVGSVAALYFIRYPQIR